MPGPNAGWRDTGMHRRRSRYAAANASRRARLPPAHGFRRVPPIRRHMGYVAIGIPIGGWGQWTDGPEQRPADCGGGPPGCHTNTGHIRRAWHIRRAGPARRLMVAEGSATASQGERSRSNPGQRSDRRPSLSGCSEATLGDEPRNAQTSGSGVQNERGLRYRRDRRQKRRRGTSGLGADWRRARRGPSA